MAPLQKPLRQLPLQHSLGLAHAAPMGLHGPQGIPQMVPTSLTHTLSQLVLQQ
jgi:hypothetical protein